MRKNKSHFLLMTVAAIYFAACSEDSNSWSAKDVCPEDGVNVYGMPNRGMFIDERDGQEYRYTTIGDQVWMAQNLNYVAEYSVCYDNNELNCDLWGRLYSLLENGENEAPMNYVMVDSICPTGWHVPSEQEWSKMITSIGQFEDKETVQLLKSTEYWTHEYSGGNGTDECGFRALPGGDQSPSKSEFMYQNAVFWTSTMQSPRKARAIYLGLGVYKGISTYRNSIRCIKD